GLRARGGAGVDDRGLALADGQGLDGRDGAGARARDVERGTALEVALDQGREAERAALALHRVAGALELLRAARPLAGDRDGRALREVLDLELHEARGGLR